MIVLGAGLVAGFGTVPEPNHTLQDLIRLYKRPSFIVYFSLIEVFTFIGLFSTHVIEYLMKIRPDHWSHPDLKMWLGIRFVVLCLYNKLGLLNDALVMVYLEPILVVKPCCLRKVDWNYCY